ncbi:hypothetical protein [Qipengyuania flava]|uniref:hypothetical protein n=1 Tax=Qipengyuania flava TaxID=192812 RepID=UPI00384DAFE7
MPTAEMCRRNGISSVLLYKLKVEVRRSGGVRCSSAFDDRAGEQRLKKLLAETVLGKVMLKDRASKNGNARRYVGSRCQRP